MSTKVKTLTQGLLDEMDRVKEIQAIYKKIPTGAIATAMMENDLQEAKRAIGIGDTIAMLRVYEKLKGYAS